MKSILKLFIDILSCIVGCIVVGGAYALIMIRQKMHEFRIKKEVFKMKIAYGNEELAIDLQNYIRFYTPTGWRGPIKDYDFYPLILDLDIPIILKGKYPNRPEFEKSYIKEAIQSWLRKKSIGIGG